MLDSPLSQERMSHRSTVSRYDNTKEILVELIAALACIVAIVLYLILKTPMIFVPSKIAAQWDSVWMANLPQACAQNSILCAPKEFLGCAQIERDFLGGWTVARWEPARNQKRIPLAISGDCDASYNASWHIHPADLDAMGQLKYFPDLSGSDLQAILATPIIAGIMTYAPGKMTAAIKWRGHLVYPVRVQ